MIAVIHMLLFS